MGSRKGGMSKLGLTAAKMLDIAWPVNTCKTKEIIAGRFNI